MRIALKDIKPNPHRDLERFPLDKQKVSQLVASIQRNEAGFWDNVLVRENKGFFELAYGHHRLAAAIEAGLKDANFIVKKLSDATMLQVMTDENDNDRSRTQVNSLVESIVAYVNAIAAGTITPELSGKTKDSFKRNAPSFLPSSLESSQKASVIESMTHPYTVLSVANFLGKSSKMGASHAVVAVFDALELVELKALSRAVVEDAPTVAALQQEVVRGRALYEQREKQKRIRQQENEALAKAAAAVKEAEEKRKIADKKAAEDAAVRQARIEEEAEKIRLAQEEKRQADTAVEKARIAKQIEEAKRRREEEEERAFQRAEEFKQKRAELDLRVEKSKQAEEQKRARIEERREAAEKEDSVVRVDRQALGSVEDIVRKAKQWNDLGRVIQEMTTQSVKWDDRLGIQRLLAEIEEGGRIQNKLWNKLQKKSPRG